VTYTVSGGTLNPTHLLTHSLMYFELSVGFDERQVVKNTGFSTCKPKRRPTRHFVS